MYLGYHLLTSYDPHRLTTVSKLISRKDIPLNVLYLFGDQ